MRLRPFICAKDFDVIRDWLPDERMHAMWCADRIAFPMEQGNFEGVMAEIAGLFDDSPFVATDDDGRLVGFFCYSLNLASNEGMLKFVIVNPGMRGQGYGKQMLRLALDYAFRITRADAVHLNVFPENVSAKKCYESVGFTERDFTPDAFTYKDESWGRCNMIFRRKHNEKTEF